VKALDTAISRSGIKVARQTCLVHLKRSRRVRDALDLLLSLAESVPTRVSPLLSYLFAPPPAGPSSNNPTSPSTPSRRVLQVPLPWWIAWAIALNYNLFTCHLILIILQESLFLREMVKYIQ
jgi:hypothetical protein